MSKPITSTTYSDEFNLKVQPQKLKIESSSEKTTAGETDAAASKIFQNVTAEDPVEHVISDWTQMIESTKLSSKEKMQRKIDSIHDLVARLAVKHRLELDEEAPSNSTARGLLERYITLYPTLGGDLQRLDREELDKSYRTKIS